MKNLKEELEKMTGKDVVLAMVRGLEKEHVKVDMTSFGISDEGVCFGCAATNAICEITESKFDLTNIDYRDKRSAYLKVGTRLLYSLEDALDSLRFGNINSYNRTIERLGFLNLLLPIPRMKLPYLTTGNYKENLIHYVNYANSI